MIDGYDIWVENLDLYPLLSYIVTISHILAWPIKTIVAMITRVNWGQVMTDTIERVR